MRSRRRLGTVLIVLGLAVIVYAAVTVLWRDPVTDVYARWQQKELDSQLDASFEAWTRPVRPIADTAPVRERRDAVATAAAAMRRDLDQGQPLGRLVIPKLGIRPVVVHGTRWGPDLSRGPGHYERTSLTGLGRTTGIAGHRTTFGAPFRHIDKLRRGDEILLELPYGAFTYRVVEHEIVESDDWSVIRRRGYDALMLSACHPLYSAAQRWIVYARLVAVEPVEGAPYTVRADVVGAAA